MHSTKHPENPRSFSLLRVSPFAVLAGAFLPGLICATSGHAQVSITVPNNSFESQLATPQTHTTNSIDNWQQTAEPNGFVSPTGFQWNQESGIFENIAGTSHIDNADGNQSAYLFNYPGVGIFQDNNSTDWQNLPPTHAFNAKFQVGQSYTLTLGVIGGGGNMQPGDELDLILYYRDAGNNMVTVADTPIIFSTAAFPTTTHLFDYQVTVPSVQSTDAWAGENIGIELVSVSGFGFGYWDVDNARLTQTPAPEPATAGLLMLGLAGLCTRRSRKSVQA